MQAQAPDQVLAQIDTLLADIPIQAIKIGLIGSAELTNALKTWLKTYKKQHLIPVILDPVLTAGGSGTLGNTASHAALQQLLPYIDILTPNSEEARHLSGETQLDSAAAQLLNYVETVFITGTHESEEDVINRCYRRELPPQAWSWVRLAGQYHGSGCTLAAALAGQLATGASLEVALETAQAYTWNSLKQGYALGRGQLFPRR